MLEYFEGIPTDVLALLKVLLKFFETQQPCANYNFSLRKLTLESLKQGEYRWSAFHSNNITGLDH